MNVNDLIQKGKTYGFIAFIGFLLIALVLRTISDNADKLLSQLHRLMGQPFQLSFLQYSDVHGYLFQMAQFIILSFIYASLIVGLYTLVRFFLQRKLKPKEIGYSSRVVIEERLSELIHSIEENKHISIIQQNLQHYFDGLTIELAKVLNVKTRDFSTHWFYTDTEGYLKVLRNEEKEKDLVDELIASSIRFKQNRVQDYIQIKKPESAIHDFLLIRNYGKVKLGLAICLYKPNLLTSEVEENIINLTSDIALLGLNDELFGEIQIKVES